jgi:SulP family sulfate permease
VVFDLSNVPMLDATVSLAIENAVKDAVDAGGQVFIVSPQSQTKQLLEGFDVFNLVPHDHVLTDRTEALRRAVGNIDREVDTSVSPDALPVGATA